MEVDEHGDLVAVSYDYDESYVALFWDMPELNHLFVVGHHRQVAGEERQDYTKYERLYDAGHLKLAWRHGWNVRVHATAPKHEIDAYAEWKAKQREK
ncbi:hypothetical protein C6Y44_09840 [Rhodococcus rhodochrous]|nr:hypothetical protein C6Y44_09840 [Rhodococcus rhodochrous]